VEESVNLQHFSLAVSVAIAIAFGSENAIAVSQENTFERANAVRPYKENTIDIDPELRDRSPVFQRWLDEVPDIWEDIATDPSFPTRLRFGYSQFNGESEGNIALEDGFVDRSGFTFNARYRHNFTDDRADWGIDGRYYMLPLGNPINIAPVFGYGRTESTEGANIGVRLVFALSRGGGADLSLMQTWLAPGTDGEIRTTTISAAYAIAPQWRLSTDLQWQNGDDRFGVLLEWLP